MNWRGWSAAQPLLEALLRERPSREIVDQRLLDAFPEFEARFQRFLRDHGHREVDFDAYSPTWIEVPWVVLDNVRLILQTPMDRPRRTKERELKIRMQQAEVELFQKLPADLHFFFAEILRLARDYTQPRRPGTLPNHAADAWRCAGACANWASAWSNAAR